MSVTASGDLTFRALFPFCGLGAGARGFLDASAHLFDRGLRFESVGGIDLDPEACADFEYLTGSKAWCVDVAALSGSQLRDRYGDEAPDCVFLSPPCKGASGLLAKRLARTEKYEAMNRLALDWTRAMLDAWPTPPRLVLLENVPRLKTRAAPMLREVKRMLRRAGYVLHEGFHCCGEIGGLAQRRRRYLLVARHAPRCTQLLYKPPQKRVRACGEVLEQVPVPATPEAREAGPLHVLPQIQWINWVRLALIPAGGDWRDLEGVLAPGQQRRSVFKRKEVARWDEPTGVITGGGANAVENVQDPRVKTAYDAGYAVLRWDQAARTIAGTTAVGCGAYAVADPRSIETVDGRRIELDAPLTPRRPPPFVPVIVSADETWHRPMTALELALLQGLPARHNGKPLDLAGTARTRHVERIGNAVPVGAARAIAERMLVTLGAAALGTFLMSGDPVWVVPNGREVDGIELEEENA